MKRFFSVTAVVMLLVVLVMGSCEKQQDENQNAIEFLKNNAILEKVGFETEDGLVGNLYSNNEQKILLLDEIQANPSKDYDPPSPNGTFSIVVEDFSFYVVCGGVADNCYNGDSFTIIYH